MQPIIEIVPVFIAALFDGKAPQMQAIWRPAAQMARPDVLLVVVHNHAKRLAFGANSD
jgi:hypothetical protein